MGGGGEEGGGVSSKESDLDKVTFKEVWTSNVARGSDLVTSAAQPARFKEHQRNMKVNCKPRAKNCGWSVHTFGLWLRLTLSVGGSVVWQLCAGSTLRPGMDLRCYPA